MARNKAKGTAAVLLSKAEALRGEKGWTREELAVRMHVGSSAYKKWIAGESKPPLDLLDAVMRIYKIPESKFHRAIADLIKEAV